MSNDKDNNLAPEMGDQAWRSQKPDAHYFEPTYSGALSFLRRPYSRDFNGVDVAVSGIPYDGAVPIARAVVLVRALFVPPLCNWLNLMLFLSALRYLIISLWWMQVMLS